MHQQYSWPKNGDTPEDVRDPFVRAPALITAAISDSLFLYCAAMSSASAKRWCGRMPTAHRSPRCRAICNTN